MSFPKVGDETFASRMDLEAAFPVTTLFVFSRDGDNLLFAAYAAVGGAADAELLENALRTMHSGL